MRHLPIILSAVLASVGLLAVSGQARAAMPTLSIDRCPLSRTSRSRRPATTIAARGYYPYYGYRPYYRPYGYYYRPYGYGYYGYGRPYRYRY